MSVKLSWKNPFLLCWWVLSLVDSTYQCNGHRVKMEMEIEFEASTSSLSFIETYIPYFAFPWCSKNHKEKLTRRGSEQLNESCDFSNKINLSSEHMDSDWNILDTLLQAMFTFSSAVDDNDETIGGGAIVPFVDMNSGNDEDLLPMVPLPLPPVSPIESTKEKNRQKTKQPAEPKPISKEAEWRALTRQNAAALSLGAKTNQHQMLPRELGQGRRGPRPRPRFLPVESVHGRQPPKTTTRKKMKIDLNPMQPLCRRVSNGHRSYLRQSARKLVWRVALVQTTQSMYRCSRSSVGPEQQSLLCGHWQTRAQVWPQRLCIKRIGQTLPGQRYWTMWLMVTLISLETLRICAQKIWSKRVKGR